MRRGLGEFLREFIESSPRWLQLGYCLALIGAGIGWCWLAGRFVSVEASKFGLIAIAIGVIGFAIVLLKNDDGYNF